MSIIPSFGQSSHDDSPTFSMDDFEGNLLNCWLENMQTILWVMKRVNIFPSKLSLLRKNNKLHKVWGLL